MNDNVCTNGAIKSLKLKNIHRQMNDIIEKLPRIIELMADNFFCVSIHYIAMLSRLAISK